MFHQQQRTHYQDHLHRQESHCRDQSAATWRLDNRPAETGISHGDPVRKRRTLNQNKPNRLKDPRHSKRNDLENTAKAAEMPSIEKEYLLSKTRTIEDNHTSCSTNYNIGESVHPCLSSSLNEQYIKSSNVDAYHSEICRNSFSSLISSCREYAKDCHDKWRRIESWDKLWRCCTSGNDDRMKSCDGGDVKVIRRGGLMKMMHVILFALTLFAITQAYSAGAVRYDTAYACEGKTLKIECRDGEVIHLIRANYGRFSITICNDHGNTDWSVNCMSTKSLRVLHTRCSSNQNCSILASTSMFGDPCPNTLKYLEAHYTCTQATTTSSTFRPSPPWLTTSQPSVWRSTTPATSLSGGVAGANSGSSAGSGAVRPAPGNSASGGAHHLAPPTFRPHITMPPDLRPGVIKSKNDGHSSESGGKPSLKVPPEVIIPSTLDEVIIEPDVTEQLPPKTKDIDDREGYTESLPKKSDDTIRDRESSSGSSNSNNNNGNNKDGNSKSNGGIPAIDRDREQHSPVGDGDSNWRHRHHTHHDNPDSSGSALPSWRHCAPIVARGLQWNWTMVGEVAVQPCPGGATGLARWRCVSTAHRLSHLQQQKRLGAPSRETLSTHHSQSRSSVLLDDFGSETLLTGRNVEQNQELSDFLDNAETLMLPDAMASSGHSDTGGTLHMQKPYDGENLGKAVWISESPDLSECRSVWLNSLETRVREGESLLSISNDLSQVTSSKTLYGGDMMTTTNIMKRLAQRMSQNIQSFPDTRQREAIVTDLLLGVVKTGSNLLDTSQQASWKDLSHPAQMRVATSLLIGLEENAFLLAEAVLREKTIVQQVKNILLSVRVLETRNVETEEFPSVIAREQWTASQDSIYLPRGALIDNSEGGLVRIVFVAFDRLEEILQPPAAPPFSPAQASHSSDEETLLQQLLATREGDGTVDPLAAAPTEHQQINKDKDNVTRVINSKVISASLGKGRHIQLSQPVRLTLRHLRTENVTNPTCVFWDYTVNVWSAEGCRVEWTNATHTGCQCVHLTNFALLMDVRAVPLQPTHRLVLHLLTIIGCSLSAIALLAAIIIFHCFRGMKSDRITIHKNLCLCLLVAELIFMFGVERTANRVVCGVIAAFLHYFFLAAFSWMFLEGFQLYAMLVEVFEPERARARWYYPAAYIVPLIIVAVSGAVDSSSYGTDRHCWLRADNYFILWFVVPVALVLLANWICLSMVIYIMCHHSNVSIKAKENNKLYKIKVWLRSSIFLAVVLGLTWTFGLLYLSEETVVFAYLFTAFNSLQGLFIFIFHIVLNENFQKECGRLGRRHRWLSCCARFAPAPTPAPATGSGSSPAAVVQGGTLPSGQSLAGGLGVLGSQGPGTKGRGSQRQHQQEDLRLDDQMDGHGQTGHPSSSVSASTTNNLQRYTLKHQDKGMNHHANHQQLDSPRSWATGTTNRPSAPPYDTNNPTSPTPHSLSMPSINNQLMNNQCNRVGTPVPIDFQQDYTNGDSNLTANNGNSRSRSPSCFSVKMTVNSQNEQGWGVVQNPLSSAAMTGTWKSTSSKIQQPTMSGTLQHEHARRMDTRTQPRHHNTDSLRMSHQRQHYHPHSHHTYSEIGRIGYRRGSENEFRDIHDDPVYEEIERNETLMSDMSDDNSGNGDGFIRQIDPHGHPKFYGDHRPLISYSPGDNRHRYDRSPVALDHQLPHGKYNTGRWGDSLERHPGADRMMYGFHPQDANMRTLAAVLKADNDVASKVLCHGPHQRVLPPYSDC